MKVWRQPDGSLETEDGEPMSLERVLRLVRKGDSPEILDSETEETVTGEVIVEALQRSTTRSELVDWLGDGLRSLTARFAESVDDAEEEVQAWIDELVETGKVTPDQASEWLEDYRNKAEQTGSKFEQRVRTVLGRQIDRLGLVRKEDLEELKQEIRSLREEVNEGE